MKLLIIEPQQLLPNAEPPITLLRLQSRWLHVALDMDVVVYKPRVGRNIVLKDRYGGPVHANLEDNQLLQYLDHLLTMERRESENAVLP